MESNWAVEHLQVIRTLMERAALYRRALAPVMTFNGVLGTLAAVAGVLAKIDAPRSFFAYWMVVGLVAIAGSFLLARRQALRDAEPFWSAPTRRVGQALLPPLFFGFALGSLLVLHGGTPSPAAAAAPDTSLFWLPLTWIALYGCALHAAGFFMPRGMKIFGGAFVLGSCALFWAGFPAEARRWECAHGLMGFFFGVLHLAYGVYLYFTEQRKNAT